MLKRLTKYRFPFFLLLLLACLLLGHGASAQVGDPDRALRTEKQKKKPRQKKRKAPDHSPRDRAQNLREKSPRKDLKPGELSTEKPKPSNKQFKDGDFSAEGPLQSRDDRYKAELNGSKNMTRKVRRGAATEPGTHHSDRSKKEGKRSTTASGTNSQGNLSIKTKEVQEPGKVYNSEDRLKASKRRKLPGTNSQGNLTVKQKDVQQPGQVYNHEDRLKASKRKKLPGTSEPGALTVKKSEIVAPGTHHSDRKEKQGQHYSSYRATRHPGDNTVKTKYVREPGVHWSERKSSFAKQYNSTEAASHPGNIKGLSKKEQARHYRNISEKAHQYQGDIKLSKRNADMHPSIAARRALTMRSHDQKEKARNRSLWLNRKLKSKEQPKSVKAKDLKPRHDKGEKEIWFD